MKHQKTKTDTFHIAFMGLLFSLSIVLAFIENLIPTSAILPPGVKLGLSNIVTMYCLFFLGKKNAIAIAVLKAVFVFITRGFIASVMSVCGGLFSIAVIIVLYSIKRLNISYLILSIAGAVAHNIAQMAVITLIFKNAFTVWYLPVLIVSGVIMGTITGIALRAVSPAFERLKINLNKNKPYKED